MRKYLKIDEIEARIMQIKDFEETVVNEAIDIEEDEDENAEVVKIKKNKYDYNTFYINIEFMEEK